MTHHTRWLPRLVLAASAAAIAVGAPTAAFADPPGDNGTVKIHAVGTPTDDRRNEPHVCSFYVDAFGFDGQQAVAWHIDTQPPTGRQQVRAGGIALADGSGRTDTMQLPDGHYKLYWTFAGEHGAGKHKVFWVDCAASASPSAPAASPTEVGGVGATASPSPTEAGPSLPVTGAPLGVLAGVGAALVAAGIVLRTRLTRLFRR